MNPAALITLAIALAIIAAGYTASWLAHRRARHLASRRTRHRHGLATWPPAHRRHS